MTMKVLPNYDKVIVCYDFIKFWSRKLAGQKLVREEGNLAMQGIRAHCKHEVWAQEGFKGLGAQGL